MEVSLQTPAHQIIKRKIALTGIKAKTRPNQSPGKASPAKRLTTCCVCCVPVAIFRPIARPKQNRKVNLAPNRADEAFCRPEEPAAQSRPGAFFQIPGNKKAPCRGF